ncbi:MAG: dTDP-glucose 4,6-dehydratase [Patescibacteria group bacterium]|nr:dTDP-glucose 4,6-dehydratase [Patescibacteria group bacterium]
MKILVTGGAGFIGSNFIKYWIKNYPEDSIVNLDKLTYAGNLENLREVENHPKYKFVKGDICDKDLVNNLMGEVDWVVHFAAESHVDRSIVDSTPFITTNVLGTQVLLDATLKNKVKRFHHISTDEVFGSLDITSPEKFRESTPYDPRSPYSASKASSDHLVRAFYHTFGLPITISNCSNNFGPNQYPEKLIPLAITNLLQGEKVPVYGDGKNIRDWLFVEDHVRAIDLILRKGQIGQTYCVGGQKEKEYSNLEVVREIISQMSPGDSLESHIEFVTDRLGHDRKYAVDWSKIERELGWKPQFSFEEQLKNTISWYKENTSWWGNIASTI